MPRQRKKLPGHLLYGKATKPGRKKRVKGQCPLQGQGTASLVGVGATPQLFRVKPTQRTKSTRCRQRSVPASNFARPQTRPPSRSTQQLCCVAPNGRDQVAGLATIAALSRTQGISLLRERQGGFAIAPDTPSQRTPMLLDFYRGFFNYGAAFSQTSEFQPARRFFAHAPACSCASVSITASEAFG